MMGLASLLEDALTFVAESLPLGEAFAEEAAKEEGEGDSEEEDEESKEGEEIQSEEAEEPAAEEEAGEEEEEEEDEPVDPKPALEEECKNSAQCRPAKQHFEHCSERVAEAEEKGEEHKGPKEDCVEEFFHLVHCASNCAAPKLFAQLK